MAGFMICLLSRDSSQGSRFGLIDLKVRGVEPSIVFEGSDCVASLEWCENFPDAIFAFP